MAINRPIINIEKGLFTGLFLTYTAFRLVFGDIFIYLYDIFVFFSFTKFYKALYFAILNSISKVFTKFLQNEKKPPAGTDSLFPTEILLRLSENSLELTTLI